MRRLLLQAATGLWLGLSAAPAAAQATLAATTLEPRAYGYFVGDLLQRRVQLTVPAGLVLDLDSLPRTRRPGQALELRRVVWNGGPELLLEYQVFHAPTEVRTLEAPPLKLRFTGAGAAGKSIEQTLRVEAWPVTVAPLLPLDVSPRNGLGDLRPDAPPPLLETAPTRQRLAVYAVLLLLAAGYLAQVYIGLPWLARRRRPYARAWRALQAVPDTATPEQTRAAFQTLHAALNASAGGVLFAAGVDAYLTAQPRYAALREDLAGFFTQSNALFFAGQMQAARLQPLRDLSRALRDAERGT